MSAHILTPSPPCTKCQARWEQECKQIRVQMAYWREVLNIHDVIPFPPPPRDCYHDILEAMVFKTPQRQLNFQRHIQTGPNLLDSLDDVAFSKVLSFVVDCSENYSKSLISMGRLMIACRRAYLMEKHLQYGDLILSCEPALVPPPAWLQQRRSRIKSIASANLTSDYDCALQEVARYSLSVSFGFSQRESGESSKIRTFSASIINSHPIQPRERRKIATCKGWLIQGKGNLSELEYESRDLAHIATKLVSVAKPDAKDNFMNERDANWYLMNSGESLSHLLMEPLLTERLGLPADFGVMLKRTLVFEDVKVEAQHHGNLFGLLLMKSVIQHVFMGLSAYYTSIVLCWACPPQFHYMRDHLSILGDPAPAAVARQAEFWGKGMLRNGRLYSREYGMLSVDEKTARSSLPAHFCRLGFRSVATAPLQIGAKVRLRGLSTTELNGVEGVLHEALTEGRVGIKLTGIMSISTATRWKSGVRVRPEHCEEYDSGSSVLFCAAHELANPCGEFKCSVVEHIMNPNFEFEDD